MLIYKGFIAEVDYDDNAEVFFGTVFNVQTIMSFRGASVMELKASFEYVVETYLDDCRREGLDPEKPFSGKITIRHPPMLHRRVAKSTGRPLAVVVESALSEGLPELEKIEEVEARLADIRSGKVKTLSHQELFNDGIGA